MSNSKSTVKELVLYKVKAEHLQDYTTEVLPELKAFLTSQKGFIAHECLKAMANDGHLVDLVVWENMEAAKTSAAEWERRTKLGDFSNMISAIEKVEFFDHLTALS
ncbi:antibiotic biosynthesis monooxygenase family protein [Roseivirga sp.]|uniref:antibiotic biosynthesis monooxygenase family protein n=1 Tax=Roseivirga sp. TaxID=1964215 RepID=UPI003B8D2E9C